ncbi:MAG: hypothetical protein WBC22_20070 [Sedimentisphaerales bacterium]
MMLVHQGNEESVIAHDWGSKFVSNSLSPQQFGPVRNPGFYRAAPYRIVAKRRPVFVACCGAARFTKGGASFENFCFFPALSPLFLRDRGQPSGS